MREHGPAERDVRERPPGAPIALAAALGAISVVASVLLFKDAYGLFAGERLAHRHPAVLFGAIFLYGAACAIFWPTPSEAPLLLYHRASLAWIIGVSALGKACGAYLVCRSWRLVDRFAPALGLGGATALRDRVRDRLARRGFAAYFLMQAVPFLPMRTSLYAYASLAPDWRLVVAGAAVGTVCRNLLMLAIVVAGYLSWRRLA